MLAWAEVSFFRRILSGDYRRAVAAEAAGEYVDAARYYALCGEREKVALMHLLRSGKADSPAEELDLLRESVRWSDPASPTRRRAARALGLSLLRRVDTRTAGERDRDTVGEAAEYLAEAGDFGGAGEAWELIGDDAAAARAYELGGLVEKMEDALGRESRRRRAGQRLAGAFEDYELYRKSGDRDAALAALRIAVDAAENKGEYRRLLDELEACLLAAGTIVLQGRGPPLHLCAVGTVTIGRSPEHTLPLRAASVSRDHVEIRPGRVLRDMGSRGGTWIGGMALAGDLPLRGEGRFTLGDECEIAWRAGETLELSVVRGLDRGLMLIQATPGHRISLRSRLGLGAHLWFQGGKPLVAAEDGATLLLNGEKALGAVQLVRKDVLAVGGVEIEVQ